MAWFSNGLVLAMVTAIVPTMRKPDHLESEHFFLILNGIYKMVATCLDFKWLGFQISDPIRNSDHLQPNLFLTIQNPD